MNILLPIHLHSWWNSFLLYRKSELLSPTNFMSHRQVMPASSYPNRLLNFLLHHLTYQPNENQARKDRSLWQDKFWDQDGRVLSRNLSKTRRSKSSIFNFHIQSKLITVNLALLDLKACFLVLRVFWTTAKTYASMIWRLRPDHFLQNICRRNSKSIHLFLLISPY